MAYSCRLWWRYHAQQSLWSKFFHSRYGNRSSIEMQLTDSPVWKRICRVYSFCIAHSELHAGLSDGQFLLKVAYDNICVVGIRRLSF